MTMSGISDQIGEAFFCSAKLADAKPQKENRYEKAQTEARPIEAALTAEQAPTKTINHANHGIERIEKPPFLRHDIGAKANRRDVKAKLHDERNDVTEVPIFYVERGNPDPNAEARTESNN